MPDIVRRQGAVAVVLVLVVMSAGAAQPSPATGHAIPGFERFLHALAQVESSGRYHARNPTSGAYGKYQIIPSSWRAWARQVLGDPDAPMTPRNQEKVARFKIHQAWHNTRSWRMVAYWWLTGRVRPESRWSTFARWYVNKVMSIYHRSPPASAAPPRAVTRYQEASRRIEYAGTWAGARHRSYAGDTVRWSDDAGARATFAFVGRSIAWIGPKGPTRGKARIWVDGRLVRTVDLYATRFRAVNTIFSRTWATARDRTLVIEVVGTRGRAVVAIDELRVRR